MNINIPTKYPIEVSILDELEGLINESASPIIFISGVMGAGKSTLARKISHKFEINNIISTDLIRAAIEPKTSESPECFPIRALDSWKNTQTKTYDSQNVLEGFLSQCRQISSYIQRITQFSEARGHGVIIEGFHIHPLVLKDIVKPNQIKLLLGGFEKETLVTRLQKRALDTHKGSMTNRSNKDIELILDIDRHLTNNAEKYDWRVLPITHNNT